MSDIHDPSEYPLREDLHVLGDNLGPSAALAQRNFIHEASLAFTSVPESALANTSFSHQLPLLQLFWDSTSLGALKTCPRLYYYSIVCGYTPRADDLNVHLRFGLEFHTALELYDRERAQGASHDDALLASVAHALRSTWNPTLKRPWSSDEPTKNRETLLRSIIWYLDQFGENDPMETIILANGEPAVELSFRFESGIRSAGGEEFFLCGHLDRLGKFQDRIYISDRKTTKSAIYDDYFRKYSPDNQISLYSLAGQLIYRETPVSGLIIDACQVLVGSSRFQRGIVTRTRAQLEEWLADTEIVLREAESYARSAYWPMRETSCTRFGRDCEFRPVCGSEPAVRPRLLETMYAKRVWDPRQVRGNF